MRCDTNAESMCIIERRVRGMNYRSEDLILFVVSALHSNDRKQTCGLYALRQEKKRNHRHPRRQLTTLAKPEVNVAINMESAVDPRCTRSTALQESNLNMAIAVNL